MRVINAEGAMLGVMPTSKALEAAREAGLDLVEVAPNERPPVCKIIDYGKFKYTQKKKLSKQKQHQVQVKEIRVRPKTGDHDIEVKVKRASEFLEHKDKVLVNVLFRGRELAHIDEGRRVMDEVLSRPRRSRQGREEPFDGRKADDGDRRAPRLSAPLRPSRVRDAPRMRAGRSGLPAIASRSPATLRSARRHRSRFAISTPCADSEPIACADTADSACPRPSRRSDGIRCAAYQRRRRTLARVRPARHRDIDIE